MAIPARLLSTTEEPQPDRRKHQRRIVRRVAALTSRGRSQEVLVVDVSAGGLKLQDAFGLKAGDPVQLEIEEVALIDGEVVWTLPHRCGIKFRSALLADDPLLKGKF